ncbi:hypothetical protein [Stieleria varia]|uniref:Uncharacterized protein n=1 Tax=Stieleria varia TaxID=2528005 RepID=A0A5C6B2G3_9BACT|nr:hypothetical protein [Stieleria varia]TWU05622.1 hypothetical protein Pla52n_13370 [Stieleria varia]
MSGRLTRIVLTAYLFIVASGLDAAQPLREQLLDVIAYHRIQFSGSELARRTYTLYEDQFHRMNETEKAAIAGCFATLSALELRDWTTVAECLSDSPDKQKAWLSDFKSMPSDSLHNAREELISRINALLGEMDSDQWDSSLGADHGPDDNLFDAGVTIRVAGKVDFDYRFIDPGVFRFAAESQTHQLLSLVDDTSDVESLLVRLWCERLMEDTESAADTTDQIVQLATAGKLSASQKEEWQYLLATLAELRGESDSVETFLESRLEKSPEGVWAHRALGLLSLKPDQRLSILQNSASRYAEGAHPLSHQVLSNRPEQTSAVLDRYWEIAWAHRRVDVRDHRSSASETDTPVSRQSTRQSAQDAYRLISELMSPTVLESWRPIDLLRIALLMDATAAVGDTETWQLYIDESLREKHPILNPLTRLSRDFSGLRRTTSTSGEIESLQPDHSETLVTLLWGNGQTVTVADAATPVAPETSRSRWIYASVVLAGLCLIAMFVLRSMRRRTR